MTKKHFIALADALRASRPMFSVSPRGFSESDERGRQWLQDIETVARFCQAQNPEFKRDRWLAYINGECGPNGGKAAAR